MYNTHIYIYRVQYSILIQKNIFIKISICFNTFIYLLIYFTTQSQFPPLSSPPSPSLLSSYLQIYLSSVFV